MFTCLYLQHELYSIQKKKKQNQTPTAAELRQHRLKYDEFVKAKLEEGKRSLAAAAAANARALKKQQAIAAAAVQEALHGIAPPAATGEGSADEGEDAGDADNSMSTDGAIGSAQKGKNKSPNKSPTKKRSKGQTTGPPAATEGEFGGLGDEQQQGIVGAYDDDNGGDIGSDISFNLPLSVPSPKNQVSVDANVSTMEMSLSTPRTPKANNNNSIQERSPQSNSKNKSPHKTPNDKNSSSQVSPRTVEKLENVVLDFDHAAAAAAVEKIPTMPASAITSFCAPDWMDIFSKDELPDDAVIPMSLSMPLATATTTLKPMPQTQLQSQSQSTLPQVGLVKASGTFPVSRKQANITAAIEADELITTTTSKANSVNNSTSGSAKLPTTSSKVSPTSVVGSAGLSASRNASASAIEDQATNVDSVEETPAYFVSGSNKEESTLEVDNNVYADADADTAYFDEEMSWLQLLYQNKFCIYTYFTHWFKIVFNARKKKTAFR